MSNNEKNREKSNIYNGSTNAQKREYYRNKRDIKNEIVNRALNECLSDTHGQASEGVILAMQTLMPTKVKQYANKRADDILKKFDFQKTRDENKNLKMFDNGDNPIHDMLYLITHGDSMRKYSAKKIELYNNDEFTDLAISYLEYCDNRKIQPNIPGLATWIGCSTAKLTKMNSGVIECACLDSVQMIMSMFQSFDESLATNFKTNGAVHIFNSKNYYGMKDKQVSDINITDDDLTKRQKIIDAIPTEYTEIN